MKVKKSLVEKIIKEEAEKMKKLISLMEEKKVISKQLNELYEDKQEVDEIFGFGKKTISRDEALNIIMSHPGKKAVYNSFANQPEKQEKYIEFVMNAPDSSTARWSPEKGTFVDATSYALGGGVKEESVNEIYEENPEEESVNEDAVPKEVLDIIPAEDQAEFQQSVQQAQQVVSAPAQPVPLEEGIMNNIIGKKIKSFIDNVLKNATPEQSSEIKNTLNQEFAGKGFIEIYKTIKSKMKQQVPQLTEVEGSQKNVKGWVKWALLATGIGSVVVGNIPMLKYADAAPDFVAPAAESAMGIVGVALFAAALVSFMILYLKEQNAPATAQRVS